MNETSKSFSFPKICIEEDEDKWNAWENDSIGSANDLENNEQDKEKLGFNLPTNDKTKVGTLDTISVDSYWVGEEEIEEIENEKKLDPINPNYKGVYEKMQAKINEENEEKKKQEIDIQDL